MQSMTDSTGKVHFFIGPIWLRLLCCEAMSFMLLTIPCVFFPPVVSTILVSGAAARPAVVAAQNIIGD